MKKKKFQGSLKKLEKALIPERQKLMLIFANRFMTLLHHSNVNEFLAEAPFGTLSYKGKLQKKDKKKSKK